MPVAAVVTLGSLWWVAGRRTPVGRGKEPYRNRRHRPSDEPARWARRRELQALVVKAPTRGRLILGTASGRLIAADPGHSVLVVGPTQTFKTTGLAVPALLEWEGPVVAASVKGDLVRDSAGWRGGKGPVWIYDPTGTTGHRSAQWSPLFDARTWAGARRVADALVEATRASSGTMTDGDFWYATAGKLLAPLLFAAAASGRTMVDVTRWVDEQETDEVVAALDAVHSADAVPALRAMRASWNRDERQRSAVYTTAETVVEVFADPTVAGSVVPGTNPVDPVELLEREGTLYLCAPAHEQRRLRPLFAGLVSRVVEVAYERAGANRAPLDPPLLVLLDEAANIAPVAELDVLASTAAGHGVQLVTVWQDLAQLTARYGPRGATVVNNHRAKLFLSGIGDPGTLDHASALIGETEQPLSSTTIDGGRASSSTTTSSMFRRLVPADALRRMAPGSGVLVSGHLPPLSLRLRPWYRDGELRRRAQPTGAPPPTLPPATPPPATPPPATPPPATPRSLLQWAIRFLAGRR
jgi:type IV secretion system protein VirD4